MTQTPSPEDPPTIEQPIIHMSNLRAKPEVGREIDDPSESVLLELLQNIESGRGTFLIVERTSDPKGETYVQTVRADDGSYTVEYREGDADHHFATSVADLRAAHEVVTGWAFEVPGWKGSYSWTPVQF